MKALNGTPNNVKTFNFDQIEKGVRLIIRGLNLDPNDENYSETPERYCRFLVELFKPKPTNFVTFPQATSDFILFKDHRLWTLCPHHLLPVELVASIAYMPGKEVLGLSKLARIMHEVNNQPLLQERFTEDVCLKLIEQVSDVKGVACYVKGQHGCTRIRGVQSEGWFVTYKTWGTLSEPAMEQRFFDFCMH